MTQEQQRIWEYLTQNCIGIRNVQNVSTIANACGFDDYGTNNDDFRAIVTDMVVNGRKPIGSCKNGYFIFTTIEERQIAIDWVDRNKKVRALQQIQPYQI